RARIVVAPFFRQPEKIAIAWPRERRVKMRKCKALSRIPVFHVVYLGSLCLIQNEHTVDETHNRVVAIPEATRNLLNRKAAILFLAIPIRGEPGFSDCIPFMRPVDVLEPN